ncbi:MAG: PDZ domain-containing protein, partial [Acetobacterium sp.]|nr:PDZ domain-containing protein [Acetobacterium sp.]
MKKFIINGVEDDSILDQMEITAGDILLSINGLPVTDILDYRYLIADESLEVEIEKADGEIWLLDIEKEYEDDLGVIFPEAMIGTKTCKNNCVFCFIDQLPTGMRESLYVKDDDERLSFLTGNYITMTNLTPDELNRIIRYRIMPMNLSIHTTNPELRIKMLRNRFAGDVMSYLESFYDNGIVMNGQIVLVPDYNDGLELAQTLNDLKAFYPVLQSLSVVPVGLSEHRQGLESLRLFNQEDALK